MRKIVNATASILACAFALSGATLGLVACGDDGNGSGGGNGGTVGGITVTDTEWENILGFDTQNYDTYTVFVKEFYSYDKSQAEDYGEWDDLTEIFYVDKKNGEMCREYIKENYDAVTGKYESYKEQTYWLNCNGIYYIWFKSDRLESANVGLLTEEDIEDSDPRYFIESIKREIRRFSKDKHRFLYNDSTQRYVYIGSRQISIQFTENKDVSVIQNYPDTKRNMQYGVKNVNGAIVIPENVRNDVNNYIIGQTE